MEDKLQYETNKDLENEKKTAMRKYALAGVWTRFYAYVIDLILIGTIFYLTIRPIIYLVGAELDATYWLSAYALLSSAFWYVYFVVMTKTWGQTIGKMIFGIRVVRNNGEPLDWQTVLFREAVGKFISKLLGLHIGFIWAFFYPKKQSWHDIIGDTFVVIEEDAYRQQFVEVGS